MSNLRRTLVLGISTVLVGLGVASCGSGTSNQQGTSFLALGWFQFEPGSTEDVVGISLMTTAFNNDTNVLVTTGGNFNPAGGSAAQTGFIDGKIATALLGVENRLATQFIRVTRVDCSYDIQGSEISVPDNSTNFGFVLGAAEFDTSEAGNIAVPAGTTPNTEFSDDNEAVRPQVIFASVPVLSTDMFAYLNANVNGLPERPFTITATCTAIGITQAGDVIETNPVALPIIVSDLSECCTDGNPLSPDIFNNGGVPGNQGGVGQGGSFSSFDSTDSGSSSSSSALSSESSSGSGSSEDEFIF